MNSETGRPEEGTAVTIGREPLLALPPPPPPALLLLLPLLSAAERNG